MSKYLIYFRHQQHPRSHTVKKTPQERGVFCFSRCIVEPTLENDLKISTLERNNFICYKKDNEPIAWSLVLPTSKKVDDLPD